MSMTDAEFKAIVLKRASAKRGGFTLACHRCGVGDEVTTHAIAVRTGWKKLYRYRGGSTSWTGECPACIAEGRGMNDDAGLFTPTQGADR